MMLKLFKLWLVALLVALPVHAAEINDFDPTDANNIARWPEGMTFANVNNAARADEGILARFWKDVNGSLSTTGAANVYAVSANQTLSAYYTGLWIRAKANFTNTGSATMNFDTLGAKTLKKGGATDLASGDIQSGVVYDWVYDGTSVQVLQLNPALITTTGITDGAVTTAKIANLNVTWGKLDDAIFNQSTIAPATGDKIPFADISNGNVKAVATVSSILALAGDGLKSIQVFTSSGTWTKPAGVNKVITIGTGPGGGGGTNATDNRNGGGGASGATCIELIDVTAISSETVTVGTGGAGALAGGNNGSNGSAATSFGAHWSAGVGTGGPANGNSTGGTCTGANVNISGSGGGVGTAALSNPFGHGGASFWGGGGALTAGAGQNASAFGAGGSGAYDLLNDGGAGANGVVVVLEFGTS